MARSPGSRSRLPSRRRQGPSSGGRATTVPVRWRSRQHGSRVRRGPSPTVGRGPTNPPRSARDPAIQRLFGRSRRPAANRCAASGPSRRGAADRFRWPRANSRAWRPYSSSSVRAWSHQLWIVRSLGGSTFSSVAPRASRSRKSSTLSARMSRKPLDAGLDHQLVLVRPEPGQVEHQRLVPPLEHVVLGRLDLVGERLAAGRRLRHLQQQAGREDALVLEALEQDGLDAGQLVDRRHGVDDLRDAMGAAIMARRAAPEGRSCRGSRRCGRCPATCSCGPAGSAGRPRSTRGRSSGTC